MMKAAHLTLLLISLITLVMTGLLLIPTTLTMRFEWDVLW